MFARRVCMGVVTKIGWVSIFCKNRFQINANYLNLRVAKCIFFKIYASSTIQQTTAFKLKCIFVHSHENPLSKNWLSQHNFKKQIPNWRKWPQFKSCQMYIFKISSSIIHQALAFNLKCIFAYAHENPWAKIGWVSIFLKNRLQIDANYLNLSVAKCIFSKSTPHQQYTRKQPSTSNSYLTTPMHTLRANIG